MRPSWAPTKPILVVGDFCNDQVIRASASRLSREQPVPVFSFLDEVVNTGCAGNVVRQLQAYGIEALGLRVATARKQRFVAGDPAREILRLDHPWQGGTQGAGLLRTLPDLAAVVYVDYRGLAGPDPAVAAALLALPCPKIADARSSLEGWGGFDVLKMNVLDAVEDHEGPSRPGAEAWAPMSTNIRGLWNAAGVPYLVLTRGRAGHIVDDGRVVVMAGRAGSGAAQNVSGAGDVFTATLAAAIGGAVEQGGGVTPDVVLLASRLAGRAAGVRVTRPGYNVAVSTEEVEA